MDVRKTVLVAHSAERMFDVIEAAEHYPDFLPWCAGAVIVARSDAEVVADIKVNFHGVRFGFRTRNPKRRPEWMAIKLEHGPFREFSGTWNLVPLSAEGCRIDFELRYDFESTPMARLTRPVFDRIANRLVDRFVARADEIHSPHGPAAASDAASRAESLQNGANDLTSSGVGSAPAPPEGSPSVTRSSPANRNDPP